MTRHPEKSGFCHQLIIRNMLDVKEWLFSPGMLFGSSEKWWGDRGTRGVPHEGCDLCFYRSSAGPIMTLEPGTQIPVLYDGQIVQIVGDFIGRTIFVRHPRHEENDWELYTLYGHVKPKEGLSPGMHIQAGDTIGGISAPREGKSAPPAHLHLSAALIVKGFPPAGLDWNVFGSPEKAFFIDPIPLIECTYAIMTLPGHR